MTKSSISLAPPIFWVLCLIPLLSGWGGLFAAELGDDPEGREDWFREQRAYPYGTIPAGAYAQAAREYVRRREDARQREALPAGPWTEMGPAPVYNAGSQSGTSYGNSAGRISAVALHPTDPGIILIGASRGGLWRSADGGASWAPVGDDQQTLVIADIAFSRSNPDIVYAATGDDDVTAWGAGVLKSVDGGLSWFRVDDGSEATGIPDGTVLSKIAVDPVNPESAVAAGYYRFDASGSGSPYTSLFRTTDGGITWRKALIPTAPGQDGLAQFKSLVIEENCPRNLWAVNYLTHTLIRSTDGGTHWATLTAAGLPPFTMNTKITVQHASCAGDATLYASVHSGNGLAGTAGYPGVFRSTDSGTTWSLPGAVPGPSGACVLQCRYDHELFVDPGDASRLYLLGRDLWTSADAGATWTNRSGGYDDTNAYHGGRMHVDLHDAAIRGSGASAALYVAGDGGLWRYDVGADTFTNLNGNLAISEFVSIAVDPDTPNRVLGGLQDNGTVLYAGAPLWSLAVPGDGGYGGWLRTVPGTETPFNGAFTSFVGNHAYLSTDAGASWTERDVWASDASFNREMAEFYAPWVATRGNNRVWHGAGSLWYCDFPATCGLTWTKQADNLAALTQSRHTSKLAIHNPAPGVLGPFYVANNYPPGFLQSPDGSAWSNRSSGLPGRYISGVVFDPASPEHVWVTVQGWGVGHVWSSPNGGQSWQDSSGDLPNVPVNRIVLDPANPASVWYIATDVGVYGTANAGVNWSVVGSNLPAALVSDIALDANRTLYAATAGRSAWKVSLPGWVAPPPEVSTALPVLLARSSSSLPPSGSIAISWQDQPPPQHASTATAYNIYEGLLGSWYSHAPLACHLGSTAAACANGRCSAEIASGEGSRYYLITASGPGGESPAGPGPGWSGPDHITAPRYAVPAPCGTP